MSTLSQTKEGLSAVLAFIGSSIIAVGATGCMLEPAESEENVDAAADLGVAQVPDIDERAYTLREAYDIINPWLIAEEDYSCLAPVVIRSVANGKHVYADTFKKPVQLKARGDKHDFRELKYFQVCRDLNGYFSFYNIHAGKYVTAMREETVDKVDTVNVITGIFLSPSLALQEVAAGKKKIFGRVLVHANEVGDWERFIIRPHGDAFSIRATSGKYFSARIDDSQGPIYAGERHVGEWELFK